MESLPSEIIQHIILQLDDKRDLCNLCLASKGLHAEAFPVLEELCPLKIIFPFEYELNQVPKDELAELQHSGRLRRARCIQIQTPGFKNHNLRCFHHGWQPPAAELKRLLRNPDHISDEEKRDCLSRQVTADLLPFLETVQENHLDHFSWELGTCIPFEIMGSNGWLARAHKRLKSLQLVVAGDCEFYLSNPSNIYNVDLGSFRDLTSLAWIGNITRAALTQLELALQQNASHLASLELDFLFARASHFDEGAAEVFAFNLFQTSNNEPGIPMFPVLERLSLSNIILGEYYLLSSQLDWDIVSHLCLRQCEGASDFLKVLTDSNVTLNIKTFEMASNPSFSFMGEAFVVSNFIESFSGLENLYLHLEAGFDDCGDFVWSSIVQAHGSTLRRLAYQAVNWRDDGIYEGSDDIYSMAMDDTTMEKLASSNPLKDLNLECLGLAASPDILVSVPADSVAFFNETKAIVFPALADQKLRLIHIRIPTDTPEYPDNPPDVRNYAALANEDADFAASHIHKPVWELLNWLFGEKGIRSLELVVFGDLSNRGQRKDEAFAIKRGAGSVLWEFYDAFNDDGPKVKSLERLIRSNIDCLESIPLDSLLAYFR